MNKKVCVYHFTNISKFRPIIYQKEAERLKNFASKFGIIDKTYVDKTMKESNQVAKMEMLKNVDYDVLVTKDFYHLNKHTNRCVEILKELSEKGVKPVSYVDGEFVLTEGELEKPLTVCTYYNRQSETEDISIGTQLDIFHLFVDTKTNWRLKTCFVDDTKTQTGIKNLLRDIAEYDIVVVKQFSDLSDRTSKFFKIRKDLEVPIYSLKEGWLNAR